MISGTSRTSETSMWELGRFIQMYRQSFQIMFYFPNKKPRSRIWWKMVGTILFPMTWHLDWWSCINETKNETYFHCCSNFQKCDWNNLKMRMRLIKLIYAEPENMILSKIWLWFVLLFSDFQTTNVFFLTFPIFVYSPCLMVKSPFSLFDFY